ncbi:hypothetical protein [Flexivirga sp.]|uniref:hypothetical protein n=1 Tax=Flexivirga sp. TaxID=1962927 RepID=UPI003F7D9EA4
MSIRPAFIKVRSRTYRKLKGIRGRHDDPFATHLPILTAVGVSQRVTSVLELGSGVLSTPAWLDRRLFPHLERLVSYEDDPVWLKEVETAVGSDPRCELRLVDRVRESVPSDLSEFDVVFIDDSQTVPERSETIAAVAATRPNSIVVNHDFEQRNYGKTVRGQYDHVRRVDTFTPQTGVCWNDTSSMDSAKLESALALVEQNREIPPRDFEAWTSVFAAQQRAH